MDVRFGIDDDETETATETATQTATATETETRTEAETETDDVHSDVTARVHVRVSLSLSHVGEGGGLKDDGARWDDFCFCTKPKLYPILTLSGSWFSTAKFCMA